MNPSSGTGARAGALSRTCVAAPGDSHRRRLAQSPAAGRPAAAALPPSHPWNIQ